MHDAGQFYLNRAKSVRNKEIFTKTKVKIQSIKRSHVVDIDTIEDFEIAEEKLKIYKKGTNLKSWKF